MFFLFKSTLNNKYQFIVQTFFNGKHAVIDQSKLIEDVVFVAACEFNCSVCCLLFFRVPSL